MAKTFSHDQFATASWQGNYDAYGPGPNDSSPRLFAIDMDIADTTVINDVYRFIYLNANSVVIDAFIKSDDLDSATSLTLDLGYDLDSGTDDPDYWLAASTIGQTGGVAKSTAVPFIADDNYFVQMLIKAAAGTAVAGTVTLYLLIGSKDAYA